MKKSYFYGMVQVDHVSCEKAKSIDYLFLASSADSRAYEALGFIAGKGTQLGKIVVFNFSEWGAEPGSESYYNYLNYGIDPILVPCSITEPFTSISVLNAIKEDLASASHIAIDISCFPKPYIAYLIKFLKNCGLTEITALYTEPVSYLFSPGLYETYHSTSGYLEVREVPGFPGDDSYTTNKLLVIIVGFDGILAETVEQFVHYDELLVINGFPSYSPYFKDISLINNLDLIKDKDVLYASANNPFDTYNLLKEIKLKYPDSFISVAALGTKPMALGACLFSILEPSIRLVDPIPEKYSDKISEECSKTWAYILPLDTKP